MKNVIKVSIGRWAFTLNEEAYALLESFLDQLKVFYEKETDTDQRMLDCENRIGEYLSDCVKSIDQVVDEKRIQQAIESLNLPDFGDRSSAGNVSYNRAGSEERPPKRLYRDPERKVLGGVFSGIGSYFGIDPVGLRLLYVIFLVIGMFSFRFRIMDNIHFRFIGMGGFAFFLLLLYLIFWILIPLARTPQEKRAMRAGRRQVTRDEHRGRQVRTTFDEPGNSSLLNFLGNFLRISIGIVLILVGATGLLVLPMLLYFWEIPVDWFGFLEVLPLNPGLSWFKILILIAVFVPLLLFLYEGVKLLFKLRFRKFRLGIVFFTLWMLSLIALAASGLIASRAFWSEGKNYSSSSLALPSDTLYIECHADMFAPQQYVCAIEDDFFVYCNKSKQGDQYLYVFPRIRLTRAEFPEMSQRVSLRAKNSFIAQINAEDALDFVEINGNRLTISPLIFDKENPWSFEQLSLHLNLPEGCVLFVPGKKGKMQELKHNRGYYYPYVGYANKHGGLIINTF